MKASVAFCHSHAHKVPRSSRAFAQNAYEQVRQALCSFVHDFDTQNVTWNQHNQAFNVDSQTFLSKGSSCGNHRDVMLEEESCDTMTFCTVNDPDEALVSRPNAACPLLLQFQSDAPCHKEFEPHAFFVLEPLKW